MLTSRLQDVVLHLNAAQYWGLCALLTAALIPLAMFCFSRLRYLRLIEDTPTARVRSAAQGFVELEGKVEFPRSPALTSPLRGTPCVWWSYRIDELDPLDDRDPAPWEFLFAAWDAVLRFFGARTGRLVESGRSHECFLIRDDTGACIIDPDRAEIIGPATRVWTKGTRRFEESTIPVGKRIYALGVFRTPHEHDQVLERREVGALISTWQLDRLKLAERFDANRDGSLDVAEWDAVWRAAAAEVRQQRAAQTKAPELHVLCSPADRHPFVLSALSQRDLAGRFWFESVVSLMGCLILGVLLAWSLGVRGFL